MNKTIALLATIISGGIVAAQAPINGKLAKFVGSSQAATFSFFTGGILMLLISLFISGGFGDLSGVRTLPWYYFIGGMLGAVYVTTVLMVVHSIGALGVTVGTMAGQLIISLTIDQFGLFGVVRQQVSVTRVIGVGLFIVGAVLSVRR